MEEVTHRNSISCDLPGLPQDLPDGTESMSETDAQTQCDPPWRQATSLWDVSMDTTAFATLGSRGATLYTKPSKIPTLEVNLPNVSVTWT